MTSLEYQHYIFAGDGIRLHYQLNFDKDNNDLLSKKPLLIFNYGLGCNNGHWQYQLSFFHELGYPIMIHDYRGHYNSTSDKGAESITFSSITEDIKKIVDDINPSQIIILGHSMGVNVTLDYVRKYPDLILGMVLISGTIIPPQGVMYDSNFFELFTPLWRGLHQKFPSFYQKLWSSSGMNPILQKLVHDGGFNKNKVSIEFVQQYLNRMGKLDPAIFFQCFEQMAKHDIINDIHLIGTKALVIGGDKDKIIPNYLQSILIDQLPDAKLYIVKDGSHVPQADFPDSINERIGFFISESF